MVRSRYSQILLGCIVEFQTDYAENFVEYAESNPGFAELVLPNYKFGERVRVRESLSEELVCVALSLRGR